jgi:hypothetical protein
MNSVTITSVKTVSGSAGGIGREAEVVLLVNGTSDTVEAVRAHIEQAVVKPSRNPRNRVWDEAALTLDAARQSEIERGDIVRSYDFPGSRNDTYVEGVAKTVEADRILIHVTTEMQAGEPQQVDRFEVWAPLGVSSMSGAPCVFLIAKRVRS